MNESYTVSIATVGIMEAVKALAPNISSKLKTIISLVLSIGLSIGFGLLNKMDITQITTLTAYSIGMTQTSYNFILKQFKDFIEKKTQIQS